MEAISRSLEALIKEKQLDKQIERQLHQWLDHPVMKGWLNNHPEVKQESLVPFIVKIKQYVQEQENCCQCPGLKACANLLKGHQANLITYSGIVDLNYTPCQYQRQAEVEAQRKQLIKSHHIAADILNGSFRHFDQSDPERLDAFHAVLQFCLNVKPGEDPTGIYLYGPLGVGKSYLLGAAVNKLAERNIASYMVYVPEFFREIKGAILEQKVEEKLNALKTVPVLILDDIGAETITVWVRDEILGPLLQYRVGHNLPTLYTSNLDYDQLEDHLAYSQKGGIEQLKAKRIMERIRHYTRPYFMNGPNRRATSR